MKATKRIFGLVLALILLMGIACAEQLEIITSNNFVQKMAVTSDRTFDLTVYETTGNMDVNNISVSIDGNELDVLGSNAGTSWIFMVDTSTVSTEYGTAPVIKTLKNLISGMGMNDNGVVCNPSTMTSNRTLASKTDLASMSNEALMETDKNNPVSFSAAVTAALNYLDTNSAAKHHTALVIISSGNPEGETSASLNALSPQIQKVNTTIYAVAYTNNNPDQNVLQAYMGLGKGSKGGKGIQQKAASKDAAAEEVINAISSNEVNFKTLSVQIPGAVQLQSANTLTVTIKGLAPTTITYNIPLEIAARLPVAAESPEPWWKENLKLIIIIGGAALIVIAGVVIILLVTRKKKNEIVEVDDAPPPPPVCREVRVTLTRQEDGEQFSAVTQGGVCVVGRSSDADIPLPDPKMKISREHMQLSYENGIVMLADLGSRNHTFVNGIMVNRKTVMQQGDIVRMGDSEFKISWRQL